MGLADELKEGPKAPRGRPVAAPAQAGRRRPVPGRRPGELEEPAEPRSAPSAVALATTAPASAPSRPAEPVAPPAESSPAAPVTAAPDLSEREAFRALPPPDKNTPRKQLAEQYGPYVRSIAGKIKKTLSKDIEFDDLVSYGMLGLFEAADRFDAKFGANFMTFSYYRIRGAIYDGLRGMGWVSRTEYQRFRMEQHANQYLSSVHEQTGQVPQGIKKSDDDEVGELANVVEGLVTIYVTALDAMEGFQIKDDRTPSVEESLELFQARKLVADAVGKLPEQERKLLELYYYKELSLEDVGKHLGLSKSWTSRLHTRAINKLSRLLRELMADYGDAGADAVRALGRSAQPGGAAGR